MIQRLMAAWLAAVLTCSGAWAMPRKPDPAQALYGFSDLGPAKARELVANAKFDQGKSLEQWLEQGWTSFRAGKADEATRAFNQAWWLQTSNGEAYVGLASVEELLRQNPTLAQKLLELGVGESPKDPQLPVAQAQFHFRHRDGENCIRQADAALSISPEAGDAWWVRAKCLAALRRETEAAVAFDRALPLIPGDPDFLSDYGSYFVLRDKPMKAREVLEPAYKAFPDHALIGLRYAQSLWATGQSKDACQAIDQVNEQGFAGNPAQISQSEALKAACRQP